MAFNAVPDSVLTGRYLKSEVKAWSTDLPNLIDHAIEDPDRMAKLISPEDLVSHLHELIRSADNLNGVILLQNAWIRFLTNPLWQARADALDDYLGTEDSLDKRRLMLASGLGGAGRLDGSGVWGPSFMSAINTHLLKTSDVFNTKSTEDAISFAWESAPDVDALILNMQSRTPDQFSSHEIEFARQSSVWLSWTSLFHKDVYLMPEFSDMLTPELERFNTISSAVAEPSFVRFSGFRTIFKKSFAK